MQNNELGEETVGIRNLAESVILQSIEDYWTPEFMEESRVFFTSEAFTAYAKIAGLTPALKYNLLTILGGENGRLKRVQRHSAE